MSNWASDMVQECLAVGKSQEHAIERAIRKTIEEAAQRAGIADDDRDGCSTCQAGLCSRHAPAQIRILAMLDDGEVG